MGCVDLLFGLVWFVQEVVHGEVDYLRETIVFTKGVTIEVMVVDETEGVFLFQKVGGFLHPCYHG